MDSGQIEKSKNTKYYCKRQLLEIVHFKVLSKFLRV